MKIGPFVLLAALSFVAASVGLVAARASDQPATNSKDFLIEGATDVTVESEDGKNTIAYTTERDEETVLTLLTPKLVSAGWHIGSVIHTNYTDIFPLDREGSSGGVLAIRTVQGRTRIAISIK